MSFFSLVAGPPTGARSVHGSVRWQDADEIAGDHLGRDDWQTQQGRTQGAENGECQSMPQLSGLKGLWRYNSADFIKRKKQVANDCD